mgnify:CR=1 FL=1
MDDRIVFSIYTNQTSNSNMLAGLVCEDILYTFLAPNTSNFLEPLQNKLLSKGVITGTEIKHAITKTNSPISSFTCRVLSIHWISGYEIMPRHVHVKQNYHANLKWFLELYAVERFMHFSQIVFVSSLWEDTTWITD